MIYHIYVIALLWLCSSFGVGHKLQLSLVQFCGLSWIFTGSWYIITIIIILVSIMKHVMASPWRLLTLWASESLQWTCQLGPLRTLDRWYWCLKSRMMILMMLIMIIAMIMSSSYLSSSVGLPNSQVTQSSIGNIHGSVGVLDKANLSSATWPNPWAQSPFLIVIILMIITCHHRHSHHRHHGQGQPEICVPLTIDSRPGLFFMSGDWFDLDNRQWQRAKWVFLFS